MGIHPTPPVADPMHGLGKTKPITPVERERENVSQDHPEAASGDRINLSEASANKASAEPARIHDAGRHGERADLSEDEADRLAQQTSAALARLHTSITRHAVRQSVDLFT